MAKLDRRAEASERLRLSAQARAGDAQAAERLTVLNNRAQSRAAAQAARPRDDQEDADARAGGLILGAAVLIGAVMGCGACAIFYQVAQWVR